MPGPFLAWPLEVKLSKAYLEIKHGCSLTLYFHTHTSLALFLFNGPLLSVPYRPLLLLRFAHVFLSCWPSQRGYTALTCLHLPPALTDQWASCVESPSFSASPFYPSQLMLCVFTTFDPRPWQHWQECQE